MSQFWQQLYWREPLWMLLVLFPLLIMLWRLVQQRHSLRQYADAALLPWLVMPEVQKRKRWFFVSQFFIWLLFALAASGPRLLLSAPQNLLPQAGAAVIVIDHSRSMLASDVFPNRRQQAYNVVTRWLQQSNKLKLGLVVFSGASHIVLPVTSDKQVLQDTAFLLDEIQLPTYGSAIVQAVQQAKSLLSHETGSRAIIMLTDGDVAQEKYKQLLQLAEQLSQEKITLHLLGVGTPSPIPLEDVAGRWLQYEGETVVTRLNETALQALAENKAVFYQRLNPAVHNELEKVWHAAAARISAQHFNEVFWRELFPWFLVPALLLIMFNHLPVVRLFLPVVIVCNLVFFAQPSPAHAAAQVDEVTGLQQAYAFWQNKNYTAAAKAYAGVDGYAARMGEGASCYRDKNLACAITAFSRAAWEAKTDQQRGRAAFNLANSFFRQGDFKSAITLYKDALRYQPQQASYKNNLEFSEEVQWNIERRLQQEADSQKAARRMSGEQGIDIDNERVSDMNITLADKTKSEQAVNPRRFKLSAEQLAYYMRRSQNFARLSGSQNKRVQRQHDWRRFSNENPVAARRVEYWQRLFEMEEDIPAHPETPKILPGVRPW